MASQAPNMLPLLYNGLEPLNRNVHGKYKVRAAESVASIASVHAIPVTVDEFALAQRFYPIVFSSGENPVPLALMGLHEGTNTFFDKDGKLLETSGIYIPAYLRRYPFMLARLRSDSDELSLCFDPTADAVGDSAAVLRNWDAIKRAERDARGEADSSALAGISRGLPEWQRAVKLQSRAARVGFDWPGTAPVIDKLHEEIDEVRVELAAAPSPERDARLEDEVGDLLFVAANLARHAKVDVGGALRRANLKFERRFRAMEAIAAAEGTTMSALTLEQQDALWGRVKTAERGQA